MLTSHLSDSSLLDIFIIEKKENSFKSATKYTKYVNIPLAEKIKIE